MILFLSTTLICSNQFLDHCTDRYIKRFDFSFTALFSVYYCKTLALFPFFAVLFNYSGWLLNSKAKIGADFWYGKLTDHKIINAYKHSGINNLQILANMMVNLERFRRPLIMVDHTWVQNIPFVLRWLTKWQKRALHSLKRILYQTCCVFIGTN